MSAGNVGEFTLIVTLFVASSNETDASPVPSKRRAVLAFVTLNCVVPVASCTFTNSTGDSRDCYMSFRCHYCTDALYSYRPNRSNACVDCYQVKNCERLYQCVECNDCQNSMYMIGSSNCFNSKFLIDCS